MSKNHLLAVLFAAVWFAPAAKVEATTISAPFVTVPVGSSVGIDVTISGASDLTSWQFDLTFNPSVVRADTVSEGPFMSAFGSTLFIPGVIDNVNGRISLVSDFYVDLPPNPSGSGVLATIGFTALMPGISPLRFENVFLNLSNTGFDISNGQITVTGSAPPAPVPEPSSLVLCATAFACAAVWGQGRRTRLRPVDVKL